MKQAKIVKIVFCGPGDVSKELEIAAEVIEKWNLRNFEALNCGVSLTNWKKNSVPSMEKRGQAVINGQLIDEADLMIAVFWRRFGTPTGMHSSGTEEEVVRAMAREIPVMLYFSDLEAPMIEPDHEQAKLLEDFRRRAMATGLPGTFRSRRDFKEQLERHLDENIRKFLTAEDGKTDGTDERVIAQSAKGDGNVQLVGDSNTVNIKSTGPKRPKVVMDYGEGFISPAQQAEVFDLVHELAVLLEQVEKKSTKQALGEAWSRLHNKFKVTKYELLRPEQLPEVRKWHNTNKRILQSKARTRAPAVHKRGRIPAIKAAMKHMGRTNEDYYPEIAARLKMKPFNSLTKLSGKNLERVYSLVLRDKKKFG
ncbi:MAG: hypothetical protein CMO55_17860 [Verrucomicrobiales bacterium]|nr:hypothetical protein [Verrucomicrobiales bacterium]